MLTDAGFANPSPLPYVNAGPGVTVANDYLAIFNDAGFYGCPVTTCIFKEPGCVNPLPAQTDVILAANPFGITAVETNVAGYSLTFCYECEVTPLGQPAIKFTKDSITIV